MKNTLDTIAYSVLDSIMYIIKDTNPINLRDIKQWIKDERNNWAKQQIDKNAPFIPKQFLQTEIVSIESIPKSFKYPDLILKKSSIIPNILVRQGGDYIISHVSLSESYVDKITFINNPNSLISHVYSNRFKSGSDVALYATVNNGELLVATADSIIGDSIEKVYLSAVFENPEEVSTFDIDNDQYPISGSLVSLLAANIIKTKFNRPLDTLYDSTNDENHDLQQKITQG